MTTRIVSAVYDSYASAQKAVRKIEAAGISDTAISIIVNQGDGPVEETKAKDGAEAGATFGGVVGAGAGVLAGLGMLAIPGIGPVIAAGWLVAGLAGAATGAAVGGAAGGIVGSLTKGGLSKDEAHFYAEAVRRGGTLVAARVPEDRAAKIQAILCDFQSVDYPSRVGDYRAEGWREFDEGAEPYRRREDYRPSDRRASR